MEQMELTEQDFETLSAYIRRVSGISISREKMYLIQHRLNHLVLSSGCHSFAEFCLKLMSEKSAELRHEIIMSITTNETCFFRDRHPFDAFKTVILPGLASRIKQQNNWLTELPSHVKAQILCVGAATGQEPYSIAMIIDDFIRAGVGIPHQAFNILAVDISRRALGAAMAAEYTPAEVKRGLTPQEILRYFTECNNIFRVKDAIRQLVSFAEVNITDPYVLPGMRFDVIFCRNILIYFDLPTKALILERLHQLLLDHGFLILGAMENTYMLSNKFESVQNGKTILYQKKKGGTG